MNEALLVFLFALATAFATGLGALPFLFLSSVSERVVAYSNAVAAGAQRISTAARKVRAARIIWANHMSEALRSIGMTCVAAGIAAIPFAVAVEFDDISVGVPNEEGGHAAEREGAGDLYFTLFQKRTGRRKRPNRQSDVCIARMFFGHVHQDVRARRRIRRTEQVQYDTARVSHDDRVSVFEPHVGNELESE